MGCEELHERGAKNCDIINVQKTNLYGGERINLKQKFIIVKDSENLSHVSIITYNQINSALRGQRQIKQKIRKRRRQ